MKIIVIKVIIIITIIIWLEFRILINCQEYFLRKASINSCCQLELREIVLNESFLSFLENLIIFYNNNY